MKRFLSLVLALASVLCMMTFVVFDASAAEDDGLVLQDIKYREIVGRVNQMDAGFTRGSTCIWSTGVTEKSTPRNDQGYQFYYIDLGKYSTDAGGEDGDLDDYFLEYLDKSLANLRKNGGTCMVRATYSINGHERKEPNDFEQLLTHQSQLASVFSKYPDVVHLIECGMIGAFGEMWGGKYSRSVYKAQVLHGWLSQLPEEITINVRTATEYIYYLRESFRGDGTVVPKYNLPGGEEPPAINSTSFSKYPFYNTIFSRVGCYNDAMIQDGNDGGSFEGSRENFIEWLGFKSEVTNYGGEFSGAREYRYLHPCWLPYSAIPEFYESHLSYYHGGNNAYAVTGQFKFESKQSRTYASVKEAELRKKQIDRNMELYAGNMPYSSEVSEDGLTVTYTTGGWSAATMDDEFFTFMEDNNPDITADLRDYTGTTVAQFFEDHVGYRMVLRSSYMNAEVAKGGVLNVKGTVDNTGFANITHNKVTELVITDGENEYVVATDIDARKWHSAKRSEYNVEIKLPASIPAGEYSVYMRVANKAPDGSTNVANCVRFANEGNSTYNVLGSDYSVFASTVKIIYDSKKNANLIGSFTVTDEVTPGSDDTIKQVYTKFDDVKDGYWGKPYIEKICIQGLMGGVGVGKFNPEGIATRAQLVTILYRMEGSPAVDDVENPFKDVKAKDWFYDAVMWASSNGIVGGVGAGKFDPNGKLTRETFATMLFRYATEYKGEPIPDKKVNFSFFLDGDTISNWAADGMAWAYIKGIIGGMTINTLVPRGKATRAQMATILSRYLGL